MFVMCPRRYVSCFCCGCCALILCSMFSNAMLSAWNRSFAHVCHQQPELDFLDGQSKQHTTTSSLSSAMMSHDAPTETTYSCPLTSIGTGTVLSGLPCPSMWMFFIMRSLACALCFAFLPLNILSFCAFHKHHIILHKTVICLTFRSFVRYMSVYVKPSGRY